MWYALTRLGVDHIEGQLHLLDIEICFERRDLFPAGLIPGRPQAEDADMGQLDLPKLLLEVRSEEPDLAAELVGVGAFAVNHEALKPVLPRTGVGG